MTSHFPSEKLIDSFQYISCHSVNFSSSTLNFIYVVQLFCIYRMILKKLKKTYLIDPKNGSQCSPNRQYLLKNIL